MIKQDIIEHITVELIIDCTISRKTVLYKSI